MNSMLAATCPPASSSYGFHCVLPKQDFAQAVARVIDALSAEPDIGLLLPCNIVVREEPDGDLVVAFMDPVAVLQMTSNPEVAAVAQDVRSRLESVRSAVTTTASTRSSASHVS